MVGYAKDGKRKRTGSDLGTISKRACEMADRLAGKSLNKQEAVKNAASEERELDAQEFLGVFAEFGDQGAHVASEAGEVVVELGIREKFAGGIVVLIEFGGGG